MDNILGRLGFYGLLLSILALLIATITLAARGNSPYILNLKEKARAMFNAALITAVVCGVGLMINQFWLYPSIHNLKG